MSGYVVCEYKERNGNLDSNNFRLHGSLTWMFVFVLFPRRNDLVLIKRSRFVWFVANPVEIEKHKISR